MKKIYFLIFCFSYLSLGGQDLTLTKVKINASDNYPIKGYLFNVEEDKVILVPKKKWVKKFLLAQDCKNCYAVPRAIIWNLKFSQKKSKPFRPLGLMISGGLGLVFIATADNHPNPDGPNGRDFAKIYTFYGAMIGGGLDLSVLLTSIPKKNTVDINIGFPNVLVPKSAVYQFNKLREKQLKGLSSILAKIEKKKRRHRKPLTIYTKDKQVVRGYIIGQKNNKLLLGQDKKRVIEYRNNPPQKLNAISLEDIYYYEFGKQ